MTRSRSCAACRALCDGAQSLLPEQLQALVVEIRVIAEVIGRTFN